MADEKLEQIQKLVATASVFAKLKAEIIATRDAAIQQIQADLAAKLTANAAQQEEVKAQMAKDRGEHGDSA